MKPRLFLIALLLAAATACPALAGAPMYACRILAEYPHSTGTFTEGLFIHRGKLYESSGGYGESFLAEVDLKTGRAIRTVSIDRHYFAEGIAPYGTTLRLLTWQSGTGFIYSLDTFERKSSFDYRPPGSPSEGWGLTHDGVNFIRSSGAPKLYVHATADFTQLRTIPVSDAGEPVHMLNELEYVHGRILANIWKKDRIAVIDPATGEVRAWINLAPLRDRITPDSGSANGIAYDAETRRLYVTGKNWDKLFEIEIDQRWWR